MWQFKLFSQKDLVAANHNTSLEKKKKKEAKVGWPTSEPLCPLTHDALLCFL